MDQPVPHFSSRRALTRPQKAAVIVQLLLGEGVDPGLSGLPEPLQERVALQLADMTSVDHGTLAAVATEFAEAVDSIGLAFKPGLAGALGTLGPALSPAAAERLRRQLAPEARGDPWDRIGTLASEDLLPFLEAEGVEVAAVILSKLKVARAAELLGRLPGTRARRIAYAMALTAGVAPDLVQRIGQELLEQIESRPLPAFGDGPGARVGAILNESASATREDVLQGLDQSDSGFASEVRRAIFTFADIPARVDPRDVPRILRAIDQPQLLRALAAALAAGLEAVTGFLLANITQRLAAQLREEMEQLGPPREKEGEDAMAALVAGIRELEAAGEVFLAPAAT